CGGGAAISVKAVTGKPIKFAGVGEKLTDIEPFHPDRMAGRILGMGDVLSLIEKAQDIVDEKAAEQLEKNLRTQRFTLEDYLTQLKQIKKMGSIRDILKMVPGLGSKLNNVDIDEDKVAREQAKNEAIILSMTRAERRNPDILNASRRRRIAAGSGTTVQEVNLLIKQYDQTRNMMKQVMSSKGRGLRNMMKGMK
ncbi:MAG: signal recognition particle protein, partial [Clostridia bacterium]|nr:signal recognition particle protein [Clostridia bacterium]